nr:immunoglobulin heavy chain junction region [Macaca mulatta]
CARAPSVWDPSDYW